MDIDQGTPGRGRPTAWLYLLPVFALLGGLGYGGYVLYDGLASIDKKFSRFVAPGEGNIKVRDANLGTQTIYVETTSTYEGNSYDTGGRVPEAEYEVIGPDDESVDLSVINGSFTYDLGSRHGVAVFRFDAAQTGTYRVTAQGRTEGQSTGEFIVAVGQFGLVDIFKRLGFVGLVTMLAMAVLIAAIWRMRRT